MQNSEKNQSFSPLTKKNERGPSGAPNLSRVTFWDSRGIIQVVKKNLTEKYFSLWRKVFSKTFFLGKKNQNFPKKMKTENFERKNRNVRKINIFEKNRDFRQK